MSDKQIILLFIKAPIMGQVKSRLAADVGEEIALGLYKNFILDMINTLKESGHFFRICYHPPEEEKAVSAWLGPYYPYMPQLGNDLGGKMEGAFNRIFSEGFASGVLIGSDVPDMPSTMVQEAFESLKNNDVVIGPAADGGYYLVGFNQDSFLPRVFDGIPWSTHTVYQETMRILQAASLRVHHLPLWRDVDAVGDLRSLFDRSRNSTFAQSKTMMYLLKTRLLEKTGMNHYE